MSTTEYPKDHVLWNPLFIVFFAVLVVAVFGIVYGNPAALSRLYALTTFDVLVIGLATLRLIRLVTYDKILQFFRNWFLNKTGTGSYTRPEKGFRRAVVELYECIWCTGMWAALVALYMYVSSPFGFFVVMMLGISAFGTVFQNLSRVIARFAEK